jgi:PPM family protein phosphatase
MYATEVAWSQIIGTRKNQQDRAAIVSWPNGFRLLLLADGMGGCAGGEVASALVVETFRAHFIQSELKDMRERMILSLDAANKQLFRLTKKQPELAGMGTTLIAAIYDGQCIQWISVGDSPMWLVRGGEIKRLNANHSMTTVLAKQVAEGEITAEEAAMSPERSHLLEAVMGEDIEMLDAPEAEMPLLPGDCLMLASDGVESCLPDDILKLCQAPSVHSEQLTLNILDAVSNVGKSSQDNASIVLMQVLSSDVAELSTVEPAYEGFVVEPPTQQITEHKPL